MPLELLLEVKNLTVQYEDGKDNFIRPIIDVSLALSASEVLALTGPSGSGKSTLLDFATGMLTREADVLSGSVSLRGRELVSPKDFERARRFDIGSVAQSDNLLPFLNVGENVRLAALFQGKDDQNGNRQLRSTEALKAVGLTEFEHRMPATLSGGQRQRVAVARAISAGASVIVLDEPTASLDAKSSEQLMGVLLELARGGFGVVIASHDPICFESATRSVAITGGALVATRGSNKHDA